MSLGYIPSQMFAMRPAQSSTTRSSVETSSTLEIEPSHAAATFTITHARRTLTNVRMWNAFLGLLHAGFAATTFALGTLDLQLTLYRTDMNWTRTLVVDGQERSFELVPSYVRNDVGLYLTIITGAFFAITSLAHIGNAFLWHTYYESQLARCRCPIRWAEYGITASLMIVAIAALMGVREYTLLIGLALLTTSGMLSGGLITELHAYPDATGRMWVQSLTHRLLPHLLGYIPIAGAWVVIVLSYYDKNDSIVVPWFVDVILVSQAGLFLSFGVVQLVQLARPPTVYIQGEIAYQVLSLVSKSLLGGLLLFNVLMRTNADDIFTR